MRSSSQASINLEEEGGLLVHARRKKRTKFKNRWSTQAPFCKKEHKTSD